MIVSLQVEISLGDFLSFIQMSQLGKQWHPLSMFNP